MNLESVVFEGLICQVVKIFDDKLKEACLAWGVNIDDNEEVARRCKVVTTESGESTKKEVHIDDNLVMMYTDWKLDPINPNEPFKVSGSFQCSDIIKPS